MIEQTLSQIAEKENFHLEAFHPLHGGDINQVYYLKTSLGELVIKLNDRRRFLFLFDKEANGLNALREGNAFKIPKVIATGEVEDWAYLILKYLKPKPEKDWTSFGLQLAKLHQQTAPKFGFEEWNYIGSLKQ